MAKPNKDRKGGRYEHMHVHSGSGRVEVHIGSVEDLMKELKEHGILLEGGPEELLNRLRHGGQPQIKRQGIDINVFEEWAKGHDWIQAEASMAGINARIVYTTPEGNIIQVFTHNARIVDIQHPADGHLENLVKIAEMFAAKEAMAAMERMIKHEGQEEGGEDDEP